jgi:hypothetical protein
VSNFCDFSNFFDIFANLNDFLQIVGFSSILYYKYDTYFSLLQKNHIRAYRPLEYSYTMWDTKIQIFVYSLHRFYNALFFIKNVIILKYSLKIRIFDMLSKHMVIISP